MTDPDIRYLAIRNLHFSEHGVPADSPEVEKARKALSDLVTRTKSAPTWDRNTRRVAKNYQRVIDEWDDHLIEHAKSLGLLPTQGEQGHEPEGKVRRTGEEDAGHRHRGKAEEPRSHG